tara:strand:+ start:827 stop:979 length:153 start_codon:yes stop_codon:yes gene_type:complete
MTMVWVTAQKEPMTDAVANATGQDASKMNLEMQSHATNWKTPSPTPYRAG